MKRLLDDATVHVSVPASSANLGPGFDAVGLALGLWDDYEVHLGGDGLSVEVVGEGASQIPRDERHLVFRCLRHGLAELGYEEPTGLLLRCTNRVPHSRGLGSSATAAVAGFALASGLDALTRDEEGASENDIPVDLDLINQLAAQVEGHPDNSSASVYGGMTLSWSDDPGSATGAQTARIDVHPDVVPVVAVPDIELSTAAARAALPTEVPLKAAAGTAGRAALLVEAMTRHPELLFPATVDRLHQEQRRIAYPATMRIVDALRERGLAAVVSGAGPTVLVLTTAESCDDVVAQATEVVAAHPASWTVSRPGIAVSGVRAYHRID